MSVLDPEGLTPTHAEPAALDAHRPDDDDCPPGAWGEEGGSFEVQTGACAYAAFEQQLPFPLEPGDAVEIIVWHDFLDAAEPATGHAAIWLGERVLWEAEVAIPGKSQALEALVELDFTPARDARLGLHLHNHGWNSWRFVAVDVHPR